MATREAIDVALWNLFLNHPGLVGTFVTTSRYLQHFEDVTPEQMPALFITQTGEGWAKGEYAKGIPAKRTLKRHLYCYCATSPGPNPSPYPATIINTLMDVVDQVIENPGNPQNVQTLGGLVEHVFINGEIIIAEGLLQQKSIAEIPIEILLP